MRFLVFKTHRKIRYALRNLEVLCADTLAQHHQTFFFVFWKRDCVVYCGRKEEVESEYIYTSAPARPVSGSHQGEAIIFFLVSGAHSDVVQVFQDTQDINARSLVFRLARRREASRPFVPALILLEELRHADMLIKQ
jgi:hypothetical protein